MTTNINLAELENLLNSLSTATTSSVIQNIESQLEHYASSDTSLIDFLAILKQDHSHALHFFSLRVIGKWVSERWDQVPDEKRYETFFLVFNYLIDHFKTLPVHITNRALKVIADIASKDWPRLIPDFLDRCVALVRDGNTMSLGIQILKILSEEYGDPSIRSGNIGRVKSLLNSYVPQIMELLFQILYNSNDSTIIKEVLSTIYSYYTWVELPQILNDHSIEALLKCVESGNESSLLAFDCINELMSRNFVPKDYQHFFLKIFNTIFSILQTITSSEANMANVNEEFVSKFTLFSQLFVKNHFSRSENFPVLEFLFLLYKYTFMQPDLEGYLECFSIWENFLDFISFHDTNFNIKNHFFEAIIAFCEELISRIQFSNNYTKLSSFEHSEEYREGEESELDRYITSSLNLISSITALYPKEVISRFAPTILNSIQQIMSDNILLEVKNIMSDDDKRKFYFLVKDKKTFLRLASTLVETFVNDLEYYFEGAVTLLKTIIELGYYFFQNELHKHDISNTLVVEINGAMSSFSPFLGALWYKISAEKISNDLLGLFNELVSGIVYFIFTTFTQTTHNPSLLAASLNLKSISTHLRCPHLIEIGNMGDLLQYSLENSSNLDYSIRKPIFTSLVSIFLLPWVNVSADQQNWEERSKSLEQIMNTIVNPLIQDSMHIQSNPSLITDPALRSRLEMSLDTLTYITQNTKEATLNDKSIHIFLLSIKNTYESCINILTTITQYHDIKLLLALSNYFIALTERFASSFDSDIIISIIDLYLLVLNKEMIMNAISNNQSDGVDLIHKFLTLLSLLVSFPECPLLEKVFIFVINEIYPHIERKLASPQIEDVFYKIIRNIATIHYSFLNNTEYFIQLFKCVIHSFETNNLESYRCNMNLIKELKDKRNLCNNHIFLNKIYNPLLSQLFNTICSGWLDILYDDIVECIYTIAHGSGFDRFYDNFLKFYLTERFYFMDQELMNYLYQSFTRETDSPSFKISISNFTNNIKILLREGKITIKS